MNLAEVTQITLIHVLGCNELGEALPWAKQTRTPASSVLGKRVFEAMGELVSNTTGKTVMVTNEENDLEPARKRQKTSAPLVDEFCGGCVPRVSDVFAEVVASPRSWSTKRSSPIPSADLWDSATLFSEPPVPRTVNEAGMALREHLEVLGCFGEVGLDSRVFAAPTDSQFTMMLNSTCGFVEELQRCSMELEVRHVCWHCVCALLVLSLRVWFENKDPPLSLIFELALLISDVIS